MLSLSLMAISGAEVQFKADICIVILSGKFFIKINHKEGKIFKLNIEGVRTAYFVSSKTSDGSIKLWHAPFDHLEYDSLRLLSETSMADCLKQKADLLIRIVNVVLGANNIKSPFQRKSNYDCSSLSTVYSVIQTP